MSERIALQEAVAHIVDQDDYAVYIDGLLAEAETRSAERARELKQSYDDGYKDAIKDIIDAARKSEEEFFRDTVLFAEVFYSILLELIPKDGILQYRIGLDYTTNAPTVLIVISHKYVDIMENIMRVGTRVDMCIYRKYNRPCCFGVITDIKLNQRLINRDFPWCRKGL